MATVVTRHRRAALWFGLLGGGVAWFAHLLLAWAISEFGCIVAARAGTGEGLVTLLLVVATVVCLAGGIAAAAAGRAAGRHGASGDGELEPFLARSGWIASGLFVLVILVQAIPILFHVGTC